MDNLPNYVFLKSDIKDGLPYRTLQDAAYSSGFYSKAEELSAALGKYYRLKFQGQKGEVLAEKAEGMYGYLANNYTAYYGYNSGWENLEEIIGRFLKKLKSKILILLL